MGGIAGVPHQRVIKALTKYGFRVLRQGKHVVMTNGHTLLTIPGHDPVNAHTLAGIVRDAGITEAQFRQAL